MTMSWFVLTPQGQSIERNLPETTVPWRDIFDNDVLIPKEKFWKFSKIINAIRKLIKFCLCSKYFDIRLNTECPPNWQLSLGS